jgi:signal transduction histidine kinase
MFTVGLAVAAVGLVWAVAWLPRVLPAPEIPWWGLAALFYLAERAVLHLRFRNDAHSFSMSEIPLVIGLYFASPLALVVGQVVGNALVLSLHRRQPLVKLAFNVTQFAVQTSMAVLVFRGVTSLGDALGPVGWAAALAAALAALLVAESLINVAIRLSGGRLSSGEALQLFGLSTLATGMNVILALIAVILIDYRPDTAWLALAPPAVVFLAYRAYVSQREERSRLQAIYEATTDLHASPQIDAALTTAATRAREMLDAEYAEILLFPTGSEHVAYRTTVGNGDVQVMQQAPPQAAASMRRLVLEHRAGLVTSPFVHVAGPGEQIEIADGVVAPLLIHNTLVGVMLVANRMGDISTFGSDDVHLLETLASQVAVSLENGRLEDSLAQLTRLKEQLEEMIRSKDQFVASVSHELRTPLTAVVALTDELRRNRDTLDENEVEEFMTLIAEQSVEISNIVEDLLVAARADIGTLALKVEDFDTAAEIQAVLNRYRTPDGRTTTDIEIVGSASEASADRLRVRQIVRNLLQNAHRYGGDRIWIELADRGEQVTIAVIDDGEGVRPGEEEVIFQPYRRSDSAANTPLSVGLGLAVSRKLARSMDGDLHYLRRERCTVFELTLPQAAATIRLPHLHA